MQLFSADATMFLMTFQQYFAHENMKNRPQKLLIIGPIFFSLLLACPKSAQISFYVMKEKYNYIIFFSIKMAPCTTSICIQTLHTVNVYVSFYIYINISIHTSQLNLAELVLGILEGAHEFEKRSMAFTITFMSKIIINWIRSYWPHEIEG